MNDDSSPSHFSHRSYLRIFRGAHRWLIPIILIAAPALAYWPILHNEFVSLDDQITIYENPYFQRITFGGMCGFWMDSYAALYAPVTYSLLAIIASLSRTRTVHGVQPPFHFYPAPFHAFDLLLHVTNVLLVYKLLRRFIHRPWPAAAGAMLFALHPVQVESVAWASETSNVLCTFFSLAALLFYVRSLPGETSDDSTPARRARQSNFLLGTEFFLLAMGSKPLAVIVPLLAMTLHWLWRQKQPKPTLVSAFVDAQPSASRDEPTILEFASTESQSGSIRKYLRGLARLIPRPILIWLALALPFAIVARVCQPVPAWWVVVPLWVRPFVAADAIAFYVCKIMIPVHLLVDYDRSPRVLMQHGWWHYTWILPVTLAVGLIWLRRKKKGDTVFAGAMWFVASLLPVLGLTVFAYQHSSDGGGSVFVSADGRGFDDRGVGAGSASLAVTGPESIAACAGGAIWQSGWMCGNSAAIGNSDVFPDETSGTTRKPCSTRCATRLTDGRGQCRKTMDASRPRCRNRNDISTSDYSENVSVGSALADALSDSCPNRTASAKADPT